MQGKVESICIVSMLVVGSLIGLVISNETNNVVGSSDPIHEDANQGGTGVTEFFGNWYVDAMEILIYKNQTIIINGNLQINDTGSLTFYNVTLEMNCTSNGQYNIDVKDGGIFHIFDYDGNNATTGDSSIIRNGATDNHFLFWVRRNASFEMKNSELHECGWDITYQGLIIDCDNVVIDNCLFSDNYLGFRLNHSINNTVANNLIFNTFDGISLLTSSFNLVQDNNITADNEALIVKDDSNNNTIRRNTISCTGVINLDHGIEIYHSYNNTLEYNLVFGIEYGMHFTHVENTTVRRNTIIDCDEGIWMYYSDNNYIDKNVISANVICIILGYHDEYNLITNNTFKASSTSTYWVGVKLDGSGHIIATTRRNMIINNTFIGNYTRYGIYSYYGDNTIIEDNYFTSNLWGIYIKRSMYNHINRNIITDNVEYGIYADTYATHNNISNNHISLSGDCGIRTHESFSWSEIYRNTVIKNEKYGLYLGDHNTHDVRIIDNIFSNPNVNVFSWTSDDILFDYNYYGDYIGVDNGSGGGVAGDGVGDTHLPYRDPKPSLHDDHPRTIITRSGTVDTYAMIQTAINHSVNGSTIHVPELIYYENLLVNETYGGCDLSIIGEDRESTIIHGRGKDDCLRVVGDYEVNLQDFTITDGINGINYHNNDKNCTLYDTEILGNEIGIHINQSSGKSILNNEIASSNKTGLYLTGSIDNKIYHNNIINNTNQSFDDSNNSNLWDNGYPSGGNYWSDYNGIDLNSTSTQDIPPPDGIGDTPYIIDLDSQDNYPLIDPLELSLLLHEGWNLISIPFVQTNNDLTTVLEPIAGSYDSVQWFDAAAGADHWKHYHTSKLPHLNDLDTISYKNGLWLHITELGGIIYDYPGTLAEENQLIQIYPGWNMVGYPSLTNHNRTTGLNNLTFDTHVDAIQWFDAATKTWHFMGPDDLFVPGRGYWVHSKVEAEWEVPL